MEFLKVIVICAGIVLSIAALGCLQQLGTFTNKFGHRTGCADNYCKKIINLAECHSHYCKVTVATSDLFTIPETSHDSFSIQWKAIPGAGNYSVQVYQDIEDDVTDFYYTVVLDQTDTTTITGLTSGRTYKGVAKTSGLKTSNKFEITTIPFAPQEGSINVSSGTDCMNITWPYPAGDVDCFGVSVTAAKDSEPCVVQNVTRPEITVTDLRPDTQYTVGITSFSGTQIDSVSIQVYTDDIHGAGIKNKYDLWMLMVSVGLSVLTARLL